VRPHQEGLPRPGDILAGRFRIERTLGAGGMGCVMAAADLRSGQPVALKIMLPQFVQSAEFSGRFLREARAAAALGSRHVVRVYEVAQLPDGGLFMVMELLQGQDLSRLLSRRGPLPIPEAVGYVLEALDAVAEAHARGFVHRDLKPSNLVLAEQPGAAPLVKVLDFGISKASALDDPSQGEALTATDSALGSPQYMSPEQLRSAKKVDHRADIWSLGVILHKLLTGTMAFEADSVGAHMAMILADPPTPLRRRRPDAPPQLEQVILRCLQRDLTQRFQNVGQLALALQPFAPPGSGPLVEHIVAVSGQGSRAALPALREAQGEIPTSPAVAVPPAPRASTALRVVGALLFVTLVSLGAVAALLLRPTVPAASIAPPASSPLVTAPPVTAPLVSSSPSALPATVRITVEVEPAEATLELDGAPVEGRTLTLPRGASHTLVARAGGYAPETREIRAEENTGVAIVLRKEKADAGAPVRKPPKKSKGPMETTL
jgi:serine/threonine-protein kinase